MERCKALGCILYATPNKDWEGIRDHGLVLGKAREAGRVAIRMAYADGTEAPRYGTHISYGRHLFYCNMKYEKLFSDGYSLYLADNGVLLCY